MNRNVAILNIAISVALTAPLAPAETAPVNVGSFPQEIAIAYGPETGLEGEPFAVAVGPDGTVLAGTDQGLFQFGDVAWARVGGMPAEPVRRILVRGDVTYVASDTSLRVLTGLTLRESVELPAPCVALAAGNDMVWVATTQGLFSLPDGRLVPAEGLPATAVRDVATHGDQVAIAADEGLFLRQPDGTWTATYPHEG
ncbi:MAG: hypothetical protein GY851_32115, partial [bacterium]|nr:hypothetical protein [bacterium]